MKTVVWTDGSCNANGMHGRGGWAALIEQAGTVREISGSAHETTHNRMEVARLPGACRPPRRPGFRRESSINGSIPTAGSTTCKSV